MKGNWITLDGIDGAGKSTQLKKLVSWLESLGLQVVRTREPGGTAVGENIRAIFLQDLPQLATEALLLFAARQELLDTVIKPALAEGKWVVSDRSSDATYAYQGAEGLDKNRIKELENWVLQGLRPDLSFFLDIDPEKAYRRLRGQKDRIEKKGVDFFARVRLGYLARAKEDPERCHVINADMNKEVLFSELQQVVRTKLLKEQG